MLELTTGEPLLAYSLDPFNKSIKNLLHLVYLIKNTNMVTNIL